MRAVANVGFDVMDAAFSGAASAVTGLVFAPLDVADRVAERFGGSRVVTGVTGGVRSTVGGGVVGVGRRSSAGRWPLVGLWSKARRRATWARSARRAGRLPGGGRWGVDRLLVGGARWSHVVGGVRAGVRSTTVSPFCLFVYTISRYYGGGRQGAQSGSVLLAREAQHVVRQRRRPQLRRDLHLRLSSSSTMADLAHGPVGVAPVRPGLPSDHFWRRLVASDQPLEGRAEEEVLARRGALGAAAARAEAWRAAARAECM